MQLLVRYNYAVGVYVTVVVCRLLHVLCLFVMDVLWLSVR